MNVRLDQTIIHTPEQLNWTGYAVRWCGSLKPEQLVQLIQESAICRPPFAESLLQRLKSKQPSYPDGCLEAVFDQYAVFCSLTTGNLS